MKTLPGPIALKVRVAYMAQSLFEGEPNLSANSVAQGA
jgi:hypothetical protein